MARISVEVEDDLLRRLRVVCARRDVTIKWAVTGLVHSWVTREEKEAESERVLGSGAEERP